MNSNNHFSLSQKALAWSVHLFTASGMVAGFMALVAGTEKQFPEAMLWLIVAFFIDGFDGMLARKFRIKEVLPYMNGKTIDYVIDFANFAIIPAYLCYQAELFPPDWAIPSVALILLVSGIYYGKEGMVSNDFYFVGFPVLWNLIFFILFFLLDLPKWGNSLFVLLFGILHFVPLKFAYPSQAMRFRLATLILGTLTVLTGVGILWIYPEKNLPLNGACIIGLSFFMALAIFETINPAPKS